MAKKQPDTHTATLSVERALGELRRQEGFALVNADSIEAIVFPIEFITPTILAPWEGRSLTLLLTPARAQSLGIETTQKTVALDVAKLPAETLLALADPTLLAPSFLPAQKKPLDSYPLLLSLAKQASLLPALLVIENVSSEGMVRVSLSDIEQYLLHPQLDILETAGAKLPIKGAENTRIVSFMAKHGSSVHLALIVGDIAKQPEPMVRVHSACVTGDILGSLRCDCGDQLQMSLDRIVENGSGILLYLNQEGRGIGITNKLRAYTLQEQGVDTFAANSMLGFDEDERDFAVAATMLKRLGVNRVKLLTNNPQKIDNLTRYGITVAQRLALAYTPGKHNHAYIDAKAKKTGHLF